MIWLGQLEKVHSTLYGKVHSTLWHLQRWKLTLPRLPRAPCAPRHAWAGSSPGWGGPRSWWSFRPRSWLRHAYGLHPFLFRSGVMLSQVSTVNFSEIKTTWVDRSQIKISIEGFLAAFETDSPIFRGKCDGHLLLYNATHGRQYFQKKSLNASKPSEHPPNSGNFTSRVRLSILNS